MTNTEERVAVQHLLLHERGRHAPDVLLEAADLDLAVERVLVRMPVDEAGAEQQLVVEEVAVALLYFLFGVLGVVGVLVVLTNVLVGAGLRREIRATSRAELERLPLRLRLPVVLHDVEGFTHREIAGILGVPEGTSKARLSEGRARLRVALASVAAER